jgi:hypothetical protein
MPFKLDTVGPYTEGSGWKGSAYDDKGGPTTLANPRGDAISVEEYPNGFVLNLHFAFMENSSRGFPNGYVMRDRNKDEQPDTDDFRIGFFGNSGIKFAGKEIQIFDTKNLVDGLNIAQADIDEATGKINNKTVAGRPYSGDKVANAISGYLYNGPNAGWIELDAARQRQNPNPQGNNKLRIEVTKGNVNNADVFFIDSKVSLRGDDGKMRTVYSGYFNVPAGNSESLRIFLQSHWGSGVKFSNISLEKKLAPAESESSSGIVAGVKNWVAGLLLLLCLLPLCAFLFVRAGDGDGSRTAGAARYAATTEDGYPPNQKELPKEQHDLRKYGTFDAFHNRREDTWTPTNSPTAVVSGGYRVVRESGGSSHRKREPVDMPDKDGYMRVKVTVTNDFQYFPDLRAESAKILHEYVPVRVTKYTFDPPWVGVIGTLPKNGDFTGCGIAGKNTDTCNYDVTDVLRRVNFNGASFRAGRFLPLTFEDCSFVGTDFSHAYFEGRICDSERPVTAFPGCDFRHANFTNAYFYGEWETFDFSKAVNLTVEQIKSTKNYKEGCLYRLILPPDIKKALDEGKKAQDAKKEK